MFAYTLHVKKSALPVFGISKEVVWALVFITGLTTAGISINVHFAQHGRNNQKTYISEALNSVLQSGSDPCEILEEWYKAARAIGDTKRANDIKKEQKARGCRRSR